MIIADSLDDVREKFTHHEEATGEQDLTKAPTHKMKRTEMTDFHEVKEGEGFGKKFFLWEYLMLIYFYS